MNSKLDEVLSKLSDEVRDLVETAREEGFNEGLGVTLPTDDQFDEYHAEVRPYGDEAEWLVLSKNQYTEDGARKAFKEYMTRDFGLDGEEIENILETLTVKWIGYKRSAGESEPSYWIGDNSATFWAAWVVETQS